MPRPTKSEILRKAFENAAALVETMDFEQLFGDFGADYLDRPQVSEDFDEAQRLVVAHIRSRIR